MLLFIFIFISPSGSNKRKAINKNITSPPNFEIWGTLIFLTPTCPPNQPSDQVSALITCRRNVPAWCAGAGEGAADRRAPLPEQRLERHGRLPGVHLARRHRLRHAVGNAESAHLRHPARLPFAANPSSAPARSVRHSLAGVAFRCGGWVGLV